MEYNFFMEIQQLKLDELIPYKDNPRINQEAVGIVKNSLQKFGFKQPIVIDKNYEIIVGHTRYYAARELQIKEVPCLIAEDLSEAEIKAYRIMDNKSSEYAAWNFGLLTKEMQDIADLQEFDLKFTGFSENEINDMLGEVDANTIDDEDIPKMDELDQMECPNCGYKFSEFTVSK